jgi:hypothetical protein
MAPSITEYRGFQIVVTPMKDHEDLWDFQYRISKPGEPGSVASPQSVTRRQTLGGYLNEETACSAGIELAKIEVDNHLALSAR